MSIFKSRRESNKKLKVAEIKVAKATVMLRGENGLGIRCVDCYLLVHKVEGKYYEVFSNRQIEKFGDTESIRHLDEVFDTPYIAEMKPLKEYVPNPELRTIDTDILFDFILNMNIRSMLVDFDDEDN